MSDKTGFVSGDELLTALNATPQEIAAGMEWIQSLHIGYSARERDERRASMLAAGMTVPDR